MNKSILVIDTPESCEKCELRKNTDSSSCPLGAILWCPLRPLPQKKKHSEQEDTVEDECEYWEIEGFNSCLEEITK